MAVAIQVDFTGTGATLENYIKSLKLLGTVPEGQHPDKDCLFHWITQTIPPDPPGLRVIDVWTSELEFQDFLPKIKAASLELGIPEPKVTTIDVANYLTAGSS